MVYYHFLLFILLIFVYNITVVYNNNNNDIWMDFLLINNNKNNKSRILFYPFIGCGYSNKIPTLLSSILLSLVSYHPMFIINWSQLLYYFHLPKSLFLQNYIFSNTVTYNRNNKSILNLLKIGITIKIYTFHSYSSYVLLLYNLTNNLYKLIQNGNNKHISLEMILEKEFLKPTNVILRYIKSFKQKAKNYYIIGIHIRTGYLSDFGEKDSRFFNNQSFSLYINAMNRIINQTVKSKLFIISDSTVTKKYLFKKYRNILLNFDIPGKICHARDSMHGKLELNECVVKLIAENYILSECNIIIGSGRSTYFRMAFKRNGIKHILV